MKIKICEKKQHMRVSNHHDVHLKYLTILNGGGENKRNKYLIILFVRYTSVKLEEKRN